MKTTYHIYRPQDRLFEPFASCDTQKPWAEMVQYFAKNLQSQLFRNICGGDDSRISVINADDFRVTTLTYKDGKVNASGEGQDIVEAMGL